MKFKKIALTLASVMAMSSIGFVGSVDLNSYAAAQPLTGTISNPLWAGMDKLVVESTTDSGNAYYLLGVNGTYEEIVKPSANATELAVASNGSQAAYVNDNGDLFLINLATKVETKISTENEPKLELQFNEAGTKLYFLYGEKIDKVNVINLSDNKMTTVLSDGVAYKSDFKVSKDESKLVYAVTKAGKVDETNDSYAVDSKGTEPQLFYFSLSAGAKPVQITTALDNKIFTNFTADNGIVYISANPDKEGMPLRKINAEGTEDKIIIGHLMVDSAFVTKTGEILVIGQNSQFKRALFTVDQNGVTKKLATLPEETLSVTINGLDQISLTVETENGEKVVILQNGKFVDLTK